jgi:hypothetical protein
VDRVTRSQQRFHPRHKLLRSKTPRRLRQRVIVLHGDDVEATVHIDSELDRGRRSSFTPSTS